MTVFLTGQNLTRNLTAKDANRMLKVAQEAEAGAGNLTTKQIRNAWEANQILVKNDWGNWLPAFSAIGIGPNLYHYDVVNIPRRDRQQSIFYSGQKTRIKKHWFRHGVIQQRAAIGEIVPCAVDGLTFAQVTYSNRGDTTDKYHGVKIALQDVANVEPDAIFGFFSRMHEYSTFFGHADLLSVNREFLLEKKRALIKLNQRNTVWRAVITNRVDTTEFDGYLSVYGNLSYATIKIYDVWSVMPNLTDLPTGSTNIPCGIELTQGLTQATSEQTNLPDITGYIISVNRGTTITNLQTVSEPP
jgi:hypothetical protein